MPVSEAQALAQIGLTIMGYALFRAVMQALVFVTSGIAVGTAVFK